MTGADHIVVADLAVHELGGDEQAPTLVLFHANGDSGGCWPDAARRWSPDYHVLAVDIRPTRTSLRVTNLLGEPVVSIAGFPTDMDPRRFVRQLAARRQRCRAACRPSNRRPSADHSDCAGRRTS